MMMVRGGDSWCYLVVGSSLLIIVLGWIYVCVRHSFHYDSFQEVNRR
jgi:hypothetical protein